VLNFLAVLLLFYSLNSKSTRLFSVVILDAEGHHPATSQKTTTTTKLATGDGACGK
jgi:hypothetical protein